jgi:hypothetical protein
MTLTMLIMFRLNKLVTTKSSDLIMNVVIFGEQKIYFYSILLFNISRKLSFALPLFLNVYHTYRNNGNNRLSRNIFFFNSKPN